MNKTAKKKNLLITAAMLLILGVFIIVWASSTKKAAIQMELSVFDTQDYLEKQIVYRDSLENELIVGKDKLTNDEYSELKSKLTVIQKSIESYNSYYEKSKEDYNEYVNGFPRSTILSIQGYKKVHFKTINIGGVCDGTTQEV